MKHNSNALIARTEGLSGEPLLTQWLAHLLSQPAYQSPLIDFFVGESIDCATICNITIQDEGVDAEGGGRPDIEIGNEQLALIVENKFDAGMTINQPSGYLQVLKRRAAKRKILTFLTPNSRKQELERGLAPYSPKYSDIVIRVCIWEALSDMLNMRFPDSELVNEFTRDILRRCKVQSPLTSNDLKSASDVLAGWLTQRELLKSIKDIIHDDPNFKGMTVALETKPEWDDNHCYMGMTVSASNWVIWIGFWNLLQRKDPGATPLIGHVYESKEVQGLFPQFWSRLKELRSNNIVAPLVHGHGWPIPIPLSVIQGRSVREQADNAMAYFVCVLNGDVKAAISRRLINR